MPPMRERATTDGMPSDIGIIDTMIGFPVKFLRENARRVLDGGRWRSVRPSSPPSAMIEAGFETFTELQAISWRS